MFMIGSLTGVLLLGLALLALVHASTIDRQPAPAGPVPYTPRHRVGRYRDQVLRADKVANHGAHWGVPA